MAGTFWALIISGSLFGAAHLSNPNATWYAALAIAIEAGLMLGILFTMTKRLWLSIGCHFAWNFVQGGIFGAAVSGGKSRGLLLTNFSGPPILTGGEFGPEASIITVTICSALFLFLYVSHLYGTRKSVRDLAKVA